MLIRAGWIFVLLTFVGVFGLFWGWTNDEAEGTLYRNSLDSEIRAACDTVSAGGMVRHMSSWLKNYELLNVSSSFEPIRDRVLAMQEELLKESATPLEGLERRERIRRTLAGLPLVGEKTYSNHCMFGSWWPYRCGTLLLWVGLPAAGIACVVLIVLICSGVHSENLLEPSSSESVGAMVNSSNCGPISLPLEMGYCRSWPTPPDWGSSHSLF